MLSSVDFISILIPLIFMIIDIVSGLMGAWKNKNIDSQIMRKGLFHKCGYILVIVLAFVCEWAMNYLQLGFDFPLLIPCCIYIVLTEIASILENIKEIAPDIANTPIFSLFTKKKEDYDVKLVGEEKEPDNAD